MGNFGCVKRRREINRAMKECDYRGDMKLYFPDYDVK